MGGKEILLGIFTIVFLTSATLLVFGDDIEATTSENPSMKAGDPLIQGEGHDHKNASQHEFGTDNMELLDFNPLTTPGNAEVQVATTPDGKTYAYLAGWNDMHIVDVTDPNNTTVTGVYNDPNTQVLDVKYLEYNGREYIIQQNQLIDPGNSDPNIGQWSDPAQVSVTLIDVTDKTNPTWVDSWYDADHPSGPHNLYTHMIDGEWYMFVANPDYEDCNDAIGEACGGVTIAHLNLVGSAARNLPNVPASGLGHTIIKVGEYEVSWETTMGGWIYIHDMTVQTWPGEDPNDPRFGRTFVYGSYWEAGLRIGDVTDVPHPVNSPEAYTVHATTCRTGFGNPLMCRWRAPEVGLWMDFLDLDGDGQPDSGPTGNENGGRVSYIHYAEPFPTMVDLSHVGYSDEPVHLVTAAVETLSTSVGVGIMYLIDTTAYTMEDGQFKFQPKLIRDWEIPYAEDHCYGADCEAHANEDSGFCSHRTISTVPTSKPMKPPTRAMAAAGMGASTSPITMLVCGSWTSRRWSTLPIPMTASLFMKKPRLRITFLTEKTARRSTRVSTTLDGSRSFGRLNITTASPTHLVSQPVCIWCNSILTFLTEFEVNPCCDDVRPC